MKGNYTSGGAQNGVYQCHIINCIPKIHVMLIKVTPKLLGCIIKNLNTVVKCLKKNDLIFSQ